MKRVTCKICGAQLDAKYLKRHAEVHLAKWRQAQTEGVRKAFPLHHAPKPKDAA